MRPNTFSKSLLTAFILLVGVVVFTESASAQWFSTLYANRSILRDSTTFRGGPVKFNSGVTIVTSGSAIASIDSFATTAAVDTLAVTGVLAGDLVFVQPYLPAHSTTPDTGSCQYDAIAISGSIVVRRAKLTAASTLKSAANYSYFIVRKN